MGLEAESKTIQTTGVAKSEAQAKAESAEIKGIQIVELLLILLGKTKVKIAQLKAEARKIEMEADLNRRRELQQGQFEVFNLNLIFLQSKLTMKMPSQTLKFIRSRVLLKLKVKSSRKLSELLVRKPQFLSQAY